jgi:Tfp pilus assembly protein PilO
MSIIFFLAALGITFGYVGPTYRGVTSGADLAKKSIKELQAEKLRYEDALSKAAEIEDVKKGLLVKYNSVTEKDREKLTKFLPDNIDFVRLIIDINNIASNMGMSLRDINFAGSEAPSVSTGNAIALSANVPYSSATLGFSVSGSYSDLVSFLNQMEKSLRLVDVESVKLEPKEKTTAVSDPKIKKVSAGIPAYKMTLLVRTYFLPTN